MRNFVYFRRNSSNFACVTLEQYCTSCAVSLPITGIAIKHLQLEKNSYELHGQLQVKVKLCFWFPNSRNGMHFREKKSCKLTHQKGTSKCTYTNELMNGLPDNMSKVDLQDQCLPCVHYTAESLYASWQYIFLAFMHEKQMGSLWMTISRKNWNIKLIMPLYKRVQTILLQTILPDFSLVPAQGERPLQLTRTVEQAYVFLSKRFSKRFGEEK